MKMEARRIIAQTSMNKLKSQAQAKVGELCETRISHYHKCDEVRLDAMHFVQFLGTSQSIFAVKLIINRENFRRCCSNSFSPPCVLSLRVVKNLSECFSIINNSPVFAPSQAHLNGTLQNDF